MRCGAAQNNWAQIQKPEVLEKQVLTFLILHWLLQEIAAQYLTFSVYILSQKSSSLIYRYDLCPHL